MIPVRFNKWLTLLALTSVMACAHSAGRNPSSEQCIVGSSEKCSTGQVCMNTEQGPACLAIPSPAQSLELALPFDDQSEVVCTHASGTGSHSWPNAFYALDLATPYDKPPSIVRASADGKAFVFFGKDGKPCPQPKGTPEKAEWDQCGDGWGNHVKVLHSGGYYTFYVHLERTGVDPN